MEFIECAPCAPDTEQECDVNEGTGATSFDECGNSKYKSQRTSPSSSGRAVLKACSEISFMSDRLNVPESITERAKMLFKKCFSKKQLKGRSHMSIASTCLYIACREDGVPRTFKEIGAVSCSSKKEIARLSTVILKVLDMSVANVTTDDLMARFCSRLGLSKQVQKAAAHVSRRAVELDVVVGRSPVSVAAAAIYLIANATEEKKTQKEIGIVTGVADVTIRESCRLMLPRAAELLPPEYSLITPGNTIVKL